MSNPSAASTIDTTTGKNKMPKDENKAADEKYRNRLNDPNMKYDEVW